MLPKRFQPQLHSPESNQCFGHNLQKNQTGKVSENNVTTILLFL